MGNARESDSPVSSRERGGMAFWLLVTLFCTICAVLARSLWAGSRRPDLVSPMRLVVFLGVAALLAVQFVNLVGPSIPQTLSRFGLEELTAGRTLSGISLAVILALVPGLGVLSSAARRTERDHSASSAIPAVMNRVSSLEMIHRLLMDCSLGATFVVTRMPATKAEAESLRLVVSNRDFQQLLDLDPNEGRVGGNAGRRDPDGMSWWIEEIAGKALTAGVPVRSERAFVSQGQTRWYLLSATARGAYVAGVITETTQNRRESIERANSANTDPLTKLSNRGHLTTIIDTEAHRTSHGVSRGFAVYFFDFDGFKAINDALGHHVGDELLKQIASRLRETFRSIDLPISTSRPCIARYGGDEYVVVVPGLTRRDEVEALAHAFLVQLREPYNILGHEVISTASIGGAICAGRKAEGDDVLRAADKAMYRAKQSGKDRFCLHDEGVLGQQGAA